MTTGTSGSVPTTTDRLGRTRLRVSRGTDGARCLVRSSVTGSDPTAPTIRPVITHHDSSRVQVCLVPEGALLLAGDAIELDLTVDPGTTLDVIEPGGTVAYDMRGASASWDVSIRVADRARLTWSGEPFIVSRGARVLRRTRLRCAASASVAMRETLVLGRHGEDPGHVRLLTDVRREAHPVLVEDLALDATSSPPLLGPHRVLASVVLLTPEQEQPSTAPTPDPEPYRFDLARPGATLWRSLAPQAHATGLDRAWAAARHAVLDRVD